MAGFDLLGQIVFGWLLADFISGLGHWFEDEIARPEWPIIGAAVVAPNLLHHEQPLAFKDSGVVGRNAITWALTAVIGALLLLTFGAQPWVFTAMAGGIVVNEAHLWAHCPAETNRFIRALQETGLLQSPRIHAAHHRHEMNSAYCILTSWLNPPLDAIGFWRAIERVFRVR